MLMTQSQDRSGAVQSPKPRRKSAYHHGDLREALIDAAYRLVAEHGASGFMVADACRLVGVSPAALYRHFEDREELLKQVSMRGFERMERIARDHKRGKAPGSVEAIAAVGHGYVAYATEAPEVFRIMCGSSPNLRVDDRVFQTGLAAMTVLLEELAVRYDTTDRDRLFETAFPLWTFVHGAAHLKINEAYHHFDPNHDVEAMISRMTPKMLPPL